VENKNKGGTVMKKKAHFVKTVVKHHTKLFLVSHWVVSESAKVMLFVVLHGIGMAIWHSKPLAVALFS
jgi:hypothetical protein